MVTPPLTTSQDYGHFASGSFELVLVEFAIVLFDFRITVFLLGFSLLRIMHFVVLGVILDLQFV